MKSWAGGRSDCVEPRGLPCAWPSDECLGLSSQRECVTGRRRRSASPPSDIRLCIVIVGSAENPLHHRHAHSPSGIRTPGCVWQRCRGPAHGAEGRHRQYLQKRENVGIDDDEWGRCAKPRHAAAASTVWRQGAPERPTRSSARSNQNRSVRRVSSSATRRGGGWHRVPTVNARARPAVDR